MQRWNENSARQYIESRGGFIDTEWNWFRLKHEVIEVKLEYERQIVDQDLECLIPFRRLKHLSLRATSVTGEGITNLRCLNTLWMIQVGQTPFGSSGFEGLRNCSSLQFLFADETPINDQDLLGLAELPLDGICLNKASISAGAVAEFCRRSRTLTKIWLCDVRFSSRERKQIAKAADGKFIQWGPRKDWRSGLSD